MKRDILVILTFVLTYSVSNSQNTTTIPAIHKVIVSDGIILQIERSPEYTLSLKTQELDSMCLIKTIENGVLTLKIKSGFGCKGKIMAFLNCPTLKELEITAKAEVSSKNVMTGDSLSIVCKSGGKAYIDLDIKYLKTYIIEGGLVKSEGYANEQEIKVSTAGSFSGYDLEGENVTVNATVNGKAKLCVTANLYANASSGGFISYKCQPKKKTINKSGNGKIEEYTE